MSCNTTMNISVCCWCLQQHHPHQNHYYRQQHVSEKKGTSNSFSLAQSWHCMLYDYMLYCRPNTTSPIKYATLIEHCFKLLQAMQALKHKSPYTYNKQHLSEWRVSAWCREPHPATMMLYRWVSIGIIVIIININIDCSVFDCVTFALILQHAACSMQHAALHVQSKWYYEKLPAAAAFGTVEVTNKTRKK